MQKASGCDVYANGFGACCQRPTGSAVAVRPSEGQLSCGLEATTALEAMASCPGAVAGYDKVPLMGAQVGPAH